MLLLSAPPPQAPTRCPSDGRSNASEPPVGPSYPGLRGKSEPAAARAKKENLARSACAWGRQARVEGRGSSEEGAEKGKGRETRDMLRRIPRGTAARLGTAAGSHAKTSSGTDCAPAEVYTRLSHFKELG
ncbi:unnamed protein product [Prorocentrum cordatum]|uniref:Uncharacterized protein n=1 Tax=Prorocentrum cordatum TaxID=2364126 RepID=A0ABN9SGW6_9DINO|nr:unnamed protein product [Polarella glacialis]